MKRARSGRPARRLRVSIEALPPATKRAMLDGVRSGPIIAGAYTSPQGTCPMLAAHRRGGRTSLDTFARAWDGYTRAAGARLATERELRTLESMLEASLGEEGAPTGTSDLGLAIAEHREAREDEERRAAAARAAEHAREIAGHGEAPGPPRVTEDVVAAALAGGASARGRVRPPSSRPGDPDRSHELRERPGWTWLRVFRRLDDYEAALAQVRDDGVAERPESLVGANH